jgi:hypothetical protein
MKSVLNLNQVISVSMLSLLCIFQVFPLPSQTLFKVPEYPYETCIVDYDLDGDNDIVVGCNGPNQDPDSIVIFFNDGWGNFEQQKFEKNNGLYLFCNDLNNDQYPDIITRNSNFMLFYKNDQSGGIGDQFFIINDIGNPYIGGIDDINLDGYLDIVNYNITIPWGWGVAFNNGNNTFTDSVFVSSNDHWFFPYSGDIDNNNRPDILVSTLDQSDSVHILFNTYPNFTRINIASPDWNPGYILNSNNDNLSDIILTRPLYIGDTWIVNIINNESHFQSCDTLRYVNGTKVSNIFDYNQDGYDDIIMTVHQSNNSPIEDSIYIHLNDQNCSYIPQQSIFIGNYYWLPTISSGDLNGDGYPEIVVRGYYTPTPDYIRILWNDGTGYFVDTNSVYVQQHENYFSNSLVVYPNPSNDFFTITSTYNDIVEVEIIDVQGQLLLRKDYYRGIKSIKLYVENFTRKPGIYQCIVKLKNQTQVIKKIIINKPY